MWGQPPSAVRASEARLGFLSSFPESKLGRDFIQLPSPTAPKFLIHFKTAELRSADRRGRLSPHKILCLRPSTAGSFRTFSAMTSSTS